MFCNISIDREVGMSSMIGFGCVDRLKRGWDSGWVALDITLAQYRFVENGF
jgi:hypothetical protein